MKAGANMLLVLAAGLTLVITAYAICGIIAGRLAEVVK